MPERARPRRDHDDDDGGAAAGPRSRRARIAIAGGAAGGVLIVALAILGHLNAARYALDCETKEVIAEQGRAFPPWGTRPLSGDEWKPISIPASFQCVPLETEELDELGDAYRAVLLERAEALLTAKQVTEVEPAAELLDQALLHARSDSDPHKAARQAVHRMQGDVAYWRASARMQKAAAELAEAAKQFEAAAGQRPRFVSDASAWAAYVRQLAEDLRAGPAGARPAQTAPAAPAAPAASERPPAPPGIALPVEPGAGSGEPPAEPLPAPPDAGIPTGGVLL